jgi:hypothetical protein
MQKERILSGTLQENTPDFPTLKLMAEQAAAAKDFDAITGTLPSNARSDAAS